MESFSSIAVLKPNMKPGSYESTHYFFLTCFVITVFYSDAPWEYSE